MGYLDSVKKVLNFSAPDKPCEISSRIARLSLAVCLVSTLGVILYASVFSTHRLHRLNYPALTSRVGSRTVHGLDPDVLPTNVSHVVFALGGSSATWPKRIEYTSTWWVPDVTRGNVWLDQEIEEATTATYVANISAPSYRISSREWTRFKFSSSRSAVRIARIITDSFKLGLPDVRWFVMGDDDTVFFVDNLVSVLARYDHKEMWYIGGNSESVEQDVMHSYDMAFGGGGFAVSYPLAERLVSVLDGCLDRYFGFYGSDQRIWACVAEIGVGLTRERGFHQFDIRGNPYGLLAAHPLAPLVSLHHLDYLDPLFPTQTRIDSLRYFIHAYRIDPARIAQQTFCHIYDRNWSLSISWGYTVQLYPSLVLVKDLQRPLQTFKTWKSWSNGPFTFNTRPVPPDPCERPIVFMLERIQKLGRVQILTSYKNAGTLQGGKTCDNTAYDHAMSVQRVTVHSEKMDPKFWTKAPRRQCYEFINGGRVKHGSLQLHIRECRSWETVTS